MLVMKDMIAALATEFAGVAEDAIKEIETSIDAMLAGKLSNSEGMLNVARQTHSLKGQGATFGFANVSLVAHLAEDYMEGVGSQLDPGKLLPFFDRITDVVAGRLPAETESARVTEGLPVPSLFNVSDVKGAVVRTVLVMPSGTQRSLIRRELAACGYPAITIDDAPQAIDHIYRIKPNLVISSMILSGISGLDLLIALKAISTTADIPCCLLTSLDDASSEFRHLPASVPMVRKGAAFGDDFADALAQLGIT
jgi:CheY-like chemotaxis protein